MAIGLLIGFERGWQLRDELPGQRVAGIRTFAMLGLFGGLLGIVGDRPVALLSAGGAVAALLVGYAFDIRQSKVVSATGAIAAMLTLLLGTLATRGEMVLASTGAALLIALLAARKPLHALIRASSEDEVQALVRLALMAMLVLPLLPDVGLGPYASLNPRRLWFVVVIVGGLSFAGYVLQRWLGRTRGGLLTAALGSIVSSTAVTVSCARQLRETPGMTNQAGIALGSTIMVTRTLVLVAVLAPFVLEDVVWLIGPALAISLVTTGALLFATRRQDAPFEGLPTKPPGFGLAFLFAALVALLSLAAAAASHALGQQAGSATIALGGMVDVDSAIAAIGAMPPGTLSAQLAAVAIAVPVAFNSLLKLGLTLSIAGRRRGGWAAVSLAVTAASVLSALLIRLV
ncbi:MAG: DUF4010 domain-containing protein [Sphingomonadales bacterium]|nr:MAG: DUF4010 domain-containing protein [Sphingomonadales bacterium]